MRYDRRGTFEPKLFCLTGVLLAGEISVTVGVPYVICFVFSVGHSCYRLGSTFTMHFFSNAVWGCEVM